MTNKSLNYKISPVNNMFFQPCNISWDFSSNLYMFYTSMFLIAGCLQDI